MNNRPLGCLALLPYRFTEIYFRAFYTFIKKLKKVIRAIIGLVTWISWLIEKFVDKIDKQLKILWLSTFIDKFDLSIDNYRQISSTIDLSTTFSMIDFDRHVTSWTQRKTHHYIAQTVQSRRALSNFTTSDKAFQQSTL